MPVKKAGLGLQNPVTSADEKTKFATCKHGADSGHDGRKQTIHRQSPSGAQERIARQKQIYNEAKDAKLGRLVKNLEASDHCLILRAKHTGS